MQGCSERGEREDMRGEGSICAQGEFPRWTPVWNRLPLAPVTQMGSVTPELEHELQHKSTARAPGFAECQVTAAPRRYLGSGRDPAGKLCTACVSLTAHSSALLTGQKKSFCQCTRSREQRIQLDSIYNISDLGTNYQFIPTKIRRASARFD